MSFRPLVFACCLLALPSLLASRAAAAPDAAAILAHPDESNLLAQGETLVGMGPTIIPLVMRRLTEAHEARTKRLALYVLGEFGPAAKASIPEIALALDDSDRWVRLNALKALAKMGPFAAGETSRILKMTADEDGSIHNEVAATVEAIGLAALPQMAKEFVREGDWRIYQALGEFGAGAIPVIAKYCEQRGQLPFSTRDATWALFGAVQRRKALPQSCEKELQSGFTAHTPTRSEIEYLARSIQNPATPEERKNGYTPDYEALNRSFILGAMGRGARSLLPDLKEAQGRVTDAKLVRVLEAAIRRIEDGREPGVDAGDPYLASVISDVAAGQEETAGALLRTLDALPRPVSLYLVNLVPSLEALAKAEPATNPSLRWQLFRYFATLGPGTLPQARRLLPALLPQTAAHDEKFWTVSQLGDFGPSATPALAPYLANPDPALRLAAARGLEKIDDDAARALLKGFWSSQGIDPYADLGSLATILKKPLKFDSGVRTDWAGLGLIAIWAIAALLDLGFVVRNSVRGRWRRELAWLAGGSLAGLVLASVWGSPRLVGVIAVLVLATNVRIVFVASRWGWRRRKKRS